MSAADDLGFGAPGQAVLVTGATGFVGRQLVAALLADGQHVIVLTRDIAHATRTLGAEVRCIAAWRSCRQRHAWISSSTWPAPASSAIAGRPRVRPCSVPAVWR